ncbi:MAG: LysR family transcriptional regulator, partial [Pseudomonadota bacterium]
MRLEWLDDILAIADLGSLKAAAERRHLSQPAFSRRLKLIEESLG